LWPRVQHAHQQKGNASMEMDDERAQKVYSFSFSKYSANGIKELEIAGDSADILSQNVDLLNVIAKAYAEESPVTITADRGKFDRGTNNVLLKDNVVATTETGTRLLTNHLDIYPSEKSMQNNDVTKIKKDNISTTKD